MLAGGLGSRFGGNKQIAEIPGLNCTIMELSIIDAHAAGVTQVVLIINQAVRSEIERTILPRLPSDLDVVLVEQHIEQVNGRDWRAVCYILRRAGYTCIRTSTWRSCSTL